MTIFHPARSSRLEPVHDGLIEAIVGTARGPLLVLDRDLTIRHANRAFREGFGDPSDSVAGRHVFEIEGGLWDAPELRRLLAQIVAGHAPVENYRLEGTSRKLGNRSLLLNVRMLEVGNEALILIAAEDVTERDGFERRVSERTAELTRLGEERFRLAQEGARMGTWDLDVATDVITWSDGLRAIYGVSHDHPAGPEAFGLLVHPDDRARVADALLEERRGASFEFECRLVRPDGETRCLLSRSTPIRDADGTLVRVLGVAVDTTELTASREALRESEDNLRQSQKMEAVGQLAGGIAHDFNNLLLIINGYGDMALKRCNGDSDLRNSITEIRRAGARAAELTQQLLVFSRRQVLNPEIFDLNEVVSEHTSMLSRVLGDDIALSVELHGREAYVEADPGQLAQVILNLAGNARDAMPEGGELAIRTATVELPHGDAAHGIAPGTYATLVVSDTGCGIDAEGQEHVFEPFFTTKEVGRGTGLGLSTVLGVVEQSRGHIVLDSAHGEGTTFTIYLPVTGAPPVPLAPNADHHDTGKEVVLLVEDDDVVRVLVENILLECGYAVLVAATPSEAIATAGAYVGDIELLVTDIVMPEMNGRRLAELLIERMPHLRCVYMSGYPDDSMIERGILPAGTVFLQKPFSAAQLASKAREALAGAPR